MQCRASLFYSVLMIHKQISWILLISVIGLVAGCGGPFEFRRAIDVHPRGERANHHECDHEPPPHPRFPRGGGRPRPFRHVKSRRENAATAIKRHTDPYRAPYRAA